eukprot:6182331-Pleurochrysis_carterae.AAC.2
MPIVDTAMYRPAKPCALLWAERMHSSNAHIVTSHSLQEESSMLASLSAHAPQARLRSKKRDVGAYTKCVHWRKELFIGKTCKTRKCVSRVVKEGTHVKLGYGCESALEVRRGGQACAFGGQACVRGGEAC